MKPRRYTDRNQIIKDIDSTHRKIARLTAIVAKQGDKDEEEMAIAKIKRLRETRLVRLGKTLAMFDTMPLIGDNEVILQKV